MAIHIFHNNLDFELLGEKFTIVHIPTSQYLQSAASLNVWIVFAALIIITFLVGYLFFYLVTFNLRATRLVEIKTRQLVTAKEQLEASNDDLKEINTELEDFTYIVSHDIRAPLVNILGFSQEIKLSCEKISKIAPAKVNAIISGEITESLDFIEKGVKSLDALTNTILDYLRSDKSPDPCDGTEYQRNPRQRARPLFPPDQKPQY